MSLNKFLLIQRPSWTLPISETILKDVGFEYVEEILLDSNAEVLKQMSESMKMDITQFIKVSTETALDILKDDLDKNGNIVTFSKTIDDLLRGGIPTGKLTELVGAPGCGKTQICLQLCVSVQIPSFLGGLNGCAVYIETNSNFSVKRIREIHNSCVTHCINISKELPPSSNSQEGLLRFAKDNPLHRITKFSVENLEQLRGSIFTVRSQLENTSKNIKLIVIDSFIFPFYTVDTNVERTKMIIEALILLHELARNYHLSVVITNELTTYVLENGSTEVTSSLGESFAHICHNRLLLGKQKRDDFYTAILQKSSEFEYNSAYFQISQDGIRDVPVE